MTEQKTFEPITTQEDLDERIRASSAENVLTNSSVTDKRGTC